MENISFQELEKLQKIAASIEKKRDLTIINVQSNKGSIGHVVTAQNKLTQIKYTIHIISICDGEDKVCAQKLENAKKHAEFLKECKHPNVFRYVDSFQIDFNYFIQMEKYEISLESWIKDSKMSKHQYIRFTCQTLSALQYYHHNNYVIQDLSLKNIFVDRDNSIKVCDFGFSCEDVKSLCISYSKEAMFYFPPVIINQSQISKGQRFEQNFSSNIWAFGICFYILGGATYQNYSQIHDSGYKYIEQLDKDLNEILSKILSQNPDLRPNMEQIKKEYEIIKQKIMNELEISAIFSEFQQIKDKDTLQALILIQMCVEIEPDNIGYSYELGNILLKLKLFDEAIKQYKSCLQKNSKYLECYYFLGCAYFENKNLDESVISFQKHLEQYPHDDKGYLYQGIALARKSLLDNTLKSEKLNLIDQAIQSYKKCLEINPQNYICYYNLGFVYDAKNMRDLAIKYYKKHIEYNPNHENSYLNLGITYEKKGLINEAISSYKNCLKLNNKTDKCYFQLGVAYYDKGMLDKSIDSYLKCLEINPKYSDGYCNSGNAYTDKGMINEAIQQYNKAIEINPNIYQYFMCLGVLYYDINKLNKAVNMYKKCIEINDNNDECWYNLAIAYKDKGMINESIKSFEQSQKINPQFYGTYSQLGYLYEKKGMIEQALKQYQQCQQLDPRNKLIQKQIDKLKLYSGEKNSDVNQNEKMKQKFGRNYYYVDSDEVQSNQDQNSEESEYKDDYDDY